MSFPCPRCQARLHPDSELCPICYVRLPPPRTGPTPGNTTSLRGLVAVLAGVMLLGLAAAIPAWFRGRTLPYERCSSAGLKTVATAQADFRTNDRDGNGLLDFWNADVRGLYSIGGEHPIKLVEYRLAESDMNPSPQSPGLSGGPVQDRRYWYLALKGDREAEPLYQSGSRFGAAAIQEDGGAKVFIISEGNTMFKRDFDSAVITGSVPPRLKGLFDGYWPPDSDLRRWTRMD